MDAQTQVWFEIELMMIEVQRDISLDTNMNRFGDSPPSLAGHPNSSPVSNKNKYVILPVFNRCAVDRWYRFFRR